MKKLFILLLIFSCIFLSGCESIEKAFHPNQTKVLGHWIDNDEIAKYDFDGFPESVEAASNGDSYCKKCDRFIEGIKRICPNCGQYI